MNKLEKQNYINLDKLPRGGGNRARGSINWSNSVGIDIEFLYNNTKGILQITKVESGSRCVYVKYNNKEYRIQKSSLLHCLLGNIINDYKFNKGDIIQDSKRDLTIIDAHNKFINGSSFKCYKYKCNVCGNIDWVRKGSLEKHNQGCNVCGTTSPKLGYNTIYDLAPWMIDIGISEEDAKLYTPQSNKKITVICPCCKTELNPIIHNVYKTKSIGCKNCGVGVSFAERFVYKLFKLISIDFVSQLSSKDFVWCKKFRYDFYIPSLNMIIETHGKQHYVETNFNMALKEIQINDKNKKKHALNNNIQYYIELDCRESNAEWIKNSILNSELSKLIDFSKIDWQQIELEMIKEGTIKNVCDYWNRNSTTITQMSKVFGLNRNTIAKYLKKGTELGICEYNYKKQLQLGGLTNAKPLNMYDSNRELIGSFKSARELSKISIDLIGSYLKASSINRVAKGDRRSYKGFYFEYIR